MMGATKLQADCLRFVASYSREHGIGPTYHEIADALGYKSKSAAHHVVEGLEYRGLIRRLKNRARGLEVVAFPHDVEARRLKNRAMVRALTVEVPAFLRSVRLHGVTIPQVWNV
jgi:SOS-response transcriptional repressor LexA